MEYFCSQVECTKSWKEKIKKNLVYGAQKNKKDKDILLKTNFAGLDVFRQASRERVRGRDTLFSNFNIFLTSRRDFRLSRNNAGSHPGGDDEYACPSCDQGDLRCPWGGECLQHNATCDGVAHCKDG